MAVELTSSASNKVIAPAMAPALRPREEGEGLGSLCLGSYFT